MEASGHDHGSHGSATDLSTVLPGSAMACAAGEELGGEGRRAARATPRSRRAATPGGPAAGRLGRSGGAGRARAAAAPPRLERSVRAAGHAAALASRPGPAPLDVPPSV